MSDLTRRDCLKVLGGAGAGALLAPAPVPGADRPQAVPILPLTSTSDVFVPGRGRAFMKFSFDFPQPSVELDGLRFGFMVFTPENTYGLDQRAMTVEATDAGLTVTCTGFVWAGGQERVPGRLVATIRRHDGALEVDAAVEMDQPVKTVTLVVRGLPRGRLSAGGNDPIDPRDDEVLFGYPFSAGDLFGGNTAWGLGTPMVALQTPDEVWSISSLDDRVRAKRFYFQPGERGYKLEAVFEAEGWTTQRRVRVPTWRIGRSATLDEAARAHYAHLERAYRIVPWERRTDVPDWARETQLVLALHGMHYTGYIFNDYARMLEILRWVATTIAPARVLAFLAAWDGRYYWDYPLYRPSDRMGGEDGWRRLIAEGRRLGFRMMPMFGANAANRQQPVFARMADAVTHRIDGERFDLDWVDWDNDRHQEGWLGYMNLGVDSWRRWLAGRIGEMIERYEVDAYFLDIVGGWMNNPQADMHEGTRHLVAELRERYPRVMPCGEMLYDGLLEFIAFYHVYSPRAARYARFFAHLSHPAPGRGSSGVHEAGFGRFDPGTLALRPGVIPTLTVVDDTFTAHRDLMEAVIDRAKERG